MPSAPRLLTPATRPLPPLPKAMLVVLGVAALAGALWPAGESTLARAGLFGTAAVGILTGFVVGAWLEERSWLKNAHRHELRRLAVLLGLPLVGLVGGAIVSGVVAALCHALGLGDTLPYAAFAAGWWVAFAALGTFVVTALDIAISATVPSFRARVVLAIFGVLVVVVGLALVLDGAVRGLVELLTGAGSLNGTLDLTIGGEKVVGDGKSFVDAADAENLSGIFWSMAAFMATPVVLSATGKLADAVMERLHPLVAAFRAVSAGELAVRVEEAGSSEFKELNTSFNQMVSHLLLAQRLEHAFGAYLSPQVLSRIRAQHGEANIPASARECSVFFADIRGFTSMSERLSPEGVLGVLNRYFDRVVDVIAAHEGYLNKFVGDAVVVVFNGPIDQPDHAARAARCAIAIQQAVCELNAAGAFPEVGELAVGIGVATGPVVAGNLGSARQMEYTVIGDTVNLAARLTSKAAGGEVWVNEANAAALPADIGRVALEAVQVKGKAKPVLPYRLLVT